MRVLPLLVVAMPLAAISLGEIARAQDGPAPPDPFVHAPAAPDPFVLEGQNLRVASGGSVVVLDLGCEGRTSLRLENKVFVTCGADGVVEVDLSNPLAPRRSGWMRVDGDATGLFLRDGRVWVEIAHVDAQPVLIRASVSALGPRMDKAPPPSPSPPEEEAESAEPTPSKRSLMAPPRRGGLWELSAMAGAFINLGPVAGGATGWASVVYRFDVPIVVRAELAPFGVAIGNSQTVNNDNNAQGANPSRVMSVAAGHLLVGLDTQFIEVALGGGGATLSNELFTSNGAPATGGPSIVEEARFGARDGLALNVESVTVAANGQFQFGSFVASVQVPLTPKVMLVVRGGGGNVGLLFGDVGARLLMQGDGGPGSIALTGFFGGAGIDFDTCSPQQPGVGLNTPGGFSNTCASTSVGGPTLGGGFEWRP
jgi:hypothetical protein